MTILKMKQIDIHTFVTDQLATWSVAADNFAALADVREIEVQVNGLTIKLQLFFP